MRSHPFLFENRAHNIPTARERMSLRGFVQGSGSVIGDLLTLVEFSVESILPVVLSIPTPDEKPPLAPILLPSGLVFAASGAS